MLEEFNLIKNAHWNIRLQTFGMFFFSIANSLFFDVVATIFIYHAIAEKVNKKHANTLLGGIEAGYGLSELIFAIPIGYFADRYSRAKIIFFGGILEFIVLVGMFLIFLGVTKWWIDTPMIPYYLTVIIYSMWGAVAGMIAGSMGALSADSIVDGQRSSVFTAQSNIALLGEFVGPLIIIILINILNDDPDSWDLGVLQKIIFTGMGINLIPLFTLFWYKDIQNQNNVTETNSQINEPFMPLEIVYDDYFFKKVPTLLFFGKFIISLGSGMTVKYWPMFLKNDCGINMNELQFLSIIIIVQIIIFQKISQNLAKKFGRLQVTVLFNFFGILIQFLFGFIPEKIYKYKIFIGIFYTLRVSIMNSSGPLLSSALMDIVPNNHRARWESMYSILTIGWCGSALLGGVISDEGNYGNTFIATAILHLFGTFLYCFIWNDIPFEK